jgi:tetratricopeptide (TPR) repeat protein
MKFQYPKPKTHTISNLQIWNLNFTDYLGFGIWCLVLLLLLISQQAITQTQFFKYPGNPVFPFAKMDDWDQTKLPRAVIYEDGKYHIWYRGWSDTLLIYGKVGYASSNDGIHWDKHPDPLEFHDSGSAWEDHIWMFSVVQKDSLFYMWFDGNHDAHVGRCIGLAWSKDGIHWTKETEPVLTGGDKGEWDAVNVYQPRVIYDGSSFHMWYNNKYSRIGYASSTDGMQWEKYSANPLSLMGKPGEWDDSILQIGTAIFNGSYFEIWYDSRGKIGFATSADGLNWSKSPDNPIIEEGELGTWEEWLAREPAVICHDSIYRMWYYGHNSIRGNIGYATSSVLEAAAWDTLDVRHMQGFIEVRIFNSAEYIMVDSIASVMPDLTGIDRINALNKLALAYSLNNSERGIGYAREALLLSHKYSYSPGRAMAHFCIGNSQYILDNYSDALSNQLKALWLYDSLEMHFESGNLLSQIASIHSITGSYDLACRYYKQALEVFEMLKDTGSLMNSLYHLGYAYLHFGDTLSAIEQFQSRLSLAEATQSLWGQVYSYEALCYAYSGKSLDSVLLYYDKAEKVLLVIDSTHYFGIDIPYKRISLPLAEAYLASGPKYYDKAESTFDKCYDMAYEGGIRALYGIAKVCMLTERYDVARKMLDIILPRSKKFLEIQNHRRFTSLNEKMEADRDLKLLIVKIYQLYYQLDTIQKNESLALKHHLLATQWRDSIFNERSRNKIGMMQGTYESESSQMQLNILQSNNEIKDLQLRQSRILLIGMGGLVFIIIFMALLFIRQNRIKAEARTVLIEQKMLRLQMNPHFIFNTLSNIMNFIEKKKADKAVHYLSNFSSLLRSTLETTRKDEILLAEEIHGLINYLELQKLRYEDIFDYRIEVDEKLDPDEMSIPPMLIQPFIENAIEHGIRHKKAKGNIVVRFILKGKIIICEVEDDGIGREKAWEAAYKSHKGHKSMATDIIKDRIANINKRMKSNISLSIIDLKSETDQALGTLVRLELPYVSD